MKKQPLLTRDVQREEPSNSSIRMLAAAIRLASSRNQTIGDKHEYYVTISQIDHIIQRAALAAGYLDIGDGSFRVSDKMKHIESTQENEGWARETMRMINELTPDIKGKAFSPDWFLLRQRLEQAERLINTAPQAPVDTAVQTKTEKDLSGTREGGISEAVTSKAVNAG